MFNSDVLIGLPIEQAEKLLQGNGISYSVNKVDTNPNSDTYLVVKVDDLYNIVCQGFKIKV